jgi:hypothetical protein
VCQLVNSLSPPHYVYVLAVYGGKTGPHDGLPLPPAIITYFGVNSPVCFCTSKIDFCISVMWAEAMMVK